MGTTILAALFERSAVYIAHVGDSRAYLCRAGAIVQLTKDHTLLQHLMDLQGALTWDEQRAMPQRCILTRALGSNDTVVVDCLRTEVFPGDRLLLCTDGLSGMLDDGILGRELAREASPDHIVERLIALANRAGGEDNITVVLVESL
jgi:protein phosphatase